MSLRPKREIARLQKCHHGGINYAEIEALGINPDEILDFSVCTNPFMPPPGTMASLDNIAVERYPDSEATELRQALAQRLGVPRENILIGNGTTELIRLIAMTYFKREDPVLLLEPTYGEYEIAGQIAGTGLLKLRGKEEDSFSPKIAEVAASIKKYQTRGVFICNPNNPTGKYLSRHDIETVLDAGDDCLLVLDEAYIGFVEESWNPVDLTGRDNVIILRSMTKEYGIPGLRLGYAVAHREIIDSLRRVCPPWNVNIIAQKVGTAVLEKKEYLEQSKLEIRESKQFLVDELSRLGFTVLPSDANYFLMKAGNAREFRKALLKHGMLVRDGTSFGLPKYARIAPRTLPECRKLVAAISGILATQ